MRNVIFFMHTSLDGFVAGTNGEMNWIKFDDDLFDFVGTMTEKADAALYGRITYEIMQGYWPTAADQPNASKHDKEHAAWYKKVSKIVLSKTINGEGLENTTILRDQFVEKISAIKNQEGKNIIIFGSPSAAQTLLGLGLVDEFWLFVNPIILGNGRPMFEAINKCINLNLIETKTFACGVIALHYAKI